MLGGILVKPCRLSARGVLIAALGVGSLAYAERAAADAPAKNESAAPAAASPDDCPDRVREKSIIVGEIAATPNDSSFAIASDADDGDRLEPIANVSENEPDLAEPPADQQPPLEPTLADAPDESSAGYAPAAPGADKFPTAADVCLDDGEYVDSTVEDRGQPALEPASFNGVVPGESTRTQVLRAWGVPVAKSVDGAQLTYELEAFPSIVVAFESDLVQSIRVELNEPVAPAKLVDRLSLASVRPAVVIDDQGAVVSTTFPERGVTFNHRPSLAAATASDDGVAPLQLEETPDGAVCEIVIGKIEAAAFAHRANSSTTCDYSRQIADLETALQLDPTVAAVRARLAQLKLAAGQAVAAEKLAAAAVDLEPRNDEYRLGWARCLKYLAHYDEAVRETRQVIESERASQLVRAQALEQLGLLAALGSSETQPRAVPLHNKAIDLADKLVASDDPQVVAAANQLLVAAHLAVAEQIAAGNWKDKDQAVADWISRASGLAEEMIASGQADVSLRLQVAVSALASGSRLDPPIDPALWIAECEETCAELDAQLDDRLARDELHWQLGLAYYYATEIQHRRGRAAEALKYGALATSALEPLAESRDELPDTHYVLGRLYFQIGAVHAVHGQDHDVACQWYDRAVEALLEPVPVTDFAGPKQHGDALVSMGVSYWQAGQKERAYELTKAGAELVEQGVAENLLAADALDVPRHNLDAMNRALGKSPTAAASTPSAKTQQVADSESQSPRPGKTRTSGNRSQRWASRGGTTGVSRR